MCWWSELPRGGMFMLVVSPRGMTQGAQNMFFRGVALLVSLATFIQGGKVPAQFLETLSYRGRGLKLIT